MFEHIETWRSRKLTNSYPYVYVDGVYLKRNWGGEVQNVSVFVAIGVNEDGCRGIIGATEGMKEERESWKTFLVWLKERCTVHFYGNIFSVTPRNCMKEVSMMLKAIHSQESKSSAREKAALVIQRLKDMKLSSAAEKLEEGIEETIIYMEFPYQHWSRIRTNNTIERLNCDIKWRTKAIGAFPDGQSALMLVCARLRHVAGTQ